jgi:hypothetical protein
MPQIISKLLLVLHFSIWATQGPQKIRPLSAVLLWQISATICVCLSIAFFFSSFDHGTFEEVATVVYALSLAFFSLKLNQKGLIYYYAYANIANRIVWSFVWKKFSSVGIGEWWDEMKYRQKLKLGDAHVTPRNIQEVQASKLGNALEAPLLHRQNRSPFNTLYFYCFIFYAFFLERLYFCFQFYFFVCFNKWLDPNKFLLEEMYLFLLSRTL